MITLVISWRPFKILHDIDVKWMYRLFIAFLDTENIWFGEIILSLGAYLNYWWTYDNFNYFMAAILNFAW